MGGNYKFTPPEHLKGRDEFAPAKNPILQCPEHIVCSGSIWFCTTCGTEGYANYEHGLPEMKDFIANHKLCHSKGDE